MVVLVFTGSAFLTPYYIGVLKAFQENFDLSHPSWKFVGLSGGVMPACFAALNIKNAPEISYKYACILYEHHCEIGYIRSMANTYCSLRYILENTIHEGIEDPDNHDYSQLKDRLWIGLSRLPNWKTQLVTGFESKDELLKIGLLSGYLPCINGLKTTWHDDCIHIDSALWTDFHPEEAREIYNGIARPGEKVIVVSPHDHKIHADIRPEKSIGYSFLLKTREDVSRMAEQGYKDTCKYIAKQPFNRI